MTKAIAFIALLVTTFTAHAETYMYGGGTAHCSVTATRQSIGQAVATVGSLDKYYAFQLFYSENYPVRFTAFTGGSDRQMYAMLQAGGIPNLQSLQNWTIPQNVTSFNDDLSAPGVFSFPIAFSTNPQSAGITGRIHLAWTLDMAQKILATLNDTSAPNFQRDPPIVSWTTPVDVDFVSYSQFGTNPTNLGQGYSQRQATNDVQVHYPIDQHDGLSYHFIVTCN